MATKQRVTRLALGAAAVVALQPLGAAPAAADHTVLVSDTVCSVGELSIGLAQNLDTDKVTVKQLRDGSVQATCHFTGLPQEFFNEDLGVHWQRPTQATKQTFPGACELAEGDLRFGSAVVHLTPGGTLKVTCTIPPG